MLLCPGFYLAVKNTHIRHLIIILNTLENIVFLISGFSWFLCNAKYPIVSRCTHHFFRPCSVKICFDTIILLYKGIFLFPEVRWLKNWINDYTKLCHKPFRTEFPSIGSKTSIIFPHFKMKTPIFHYNSKCHEVELKHYTTGAIWSINSHALYDWLF